MKHRLLLIVLCVGLSHLATAGDLIVSGSVSGTWGIGTNVVVEGPVFVEDGESLMIEHGVSVQFRTVDRFTIIGNLAIAGRASEPVVLQVPDGWAGFEFRSASGMNVLSYVVTDREFGEPHVVVSAEDTYLEIHDCDFHARDICMNISHGRLRATDNHFITSGAYSKTVKLYHLEHSGDVEDPNSYCETNQGNAFAYNLIQVDATNAPIPDADGSAYGIWIDGSAETCLMGNHIQMEGLPLKACGLYLGEAQNSGGTRTWKLTNAIIRVSSARGPSECVSNDYQGTLEIEKSDLDAEVTDASSNYRATAVRASGSAFVKVNTSNNTLSAPGFDPWNTSASPTASIRVEYSLVWLEQIAMLASPIDPADAFIGESLGPVDPVIELDDEGANVTYHAVITDQRPLYSMAGGVGLWEAYEDAEAYYSLMPASPCRDSGDPELENDPDQTRADMGRYYFDSTLEGVDDRGGALPAEFAIHAAYPNPFNPGTTIPFELARGGHVAVVVYDILGREAATLHNGQLLRGAYALQFDARELSSGVYLVRFEFDGAAIGSQKIVLLK